MSYINQLWDFVWNVRFAQLPYMWIGLAAVLLMVFWRKQQKAVAHTAVRGKHKTSKLAVRVLICLTLLASSWLCLSAGVSQPMYKTVTYPKHYEAREFIFSLDRSGSMYTWDVEAPTLAAKVDAWQEQLYKDMLEWRRKFPLLYTKAPEPLSKRDANTSKSMIQRFAAGLYISYHVLESRPKDSTDRYAFFTFDDRAYWLEPLGRDRQLVMEAIPEISRNGGGGTNFDGPRQGVADKGAVQETIDHFKRLGKAKTRVMVFVSDGDAGIDPKRHVQFVEQMTKKDGANLVETSNFEATADERLRQFGEAAKKAKDEGQEVHIFFLLAGPKTNFTGTTADSMKKLVKAVNPNTPEFQNAVIWVGDEAGMEKALDTFNRLETSPVKSDPVTQENPVRHEFILAGLILAGLFVVSCTLFRENY
jgi:hypothetical protein